MYTYIFFYYFQMGTTPSVSASTASVEDTKTSSSPIQIEIPEKQSSAEPISRERTISVTSVPDQEVPNSETTIEAAPEAANTSDNNKTNPLESSNSAIIHPASSSVSVEESIGTDSDIHSEDSEYNVCFFLQLFVYLFF